MIFGARVAWGAPAGVLLTTLGLRLELPEQPLNSATVATMPFITDQWVPVRCEINLDTDWIDIFYNDSLFTGYKWTTGVTGGGALNIGAVDLYAFGSSAVYYDDMSLLPTVVPEPASGFLLGLSLLLLGRRRRG